MKSTTFFDHFGHSQLWLIIVASGTFNTSKLCNWTSSRIIKKIVQLQNLITIDLEFSVCASARTSSYLRSEKKKKSWVTENPTRSRSLLPTVSLSLSAKRRGWEPSSNLTRKSTHTGKNIMNLEKNSPDAHRKRYPNAVHHCDNLRLYRVNYSTTRSLRKE